MNALIRAMLVGSVVGLAQVLLHLHGPRDLAANELPMFFLPLPLGMLLAWYGRLPRWWLVALLGQCVVIVLALPVGRGQAGGVVPGGSLRGRPGRP